jgi:hypothetical protein
MDNTLATTLQRTLGIPMPQSSAHACQLLAPFRDELARLRGVDQAVREQLGTSDYDSTIAALSAVR